MRFLRSAWRLTSGVMLIAVVTAPGTVGAAQLRADESVTIRDSQAITDDLYVVGGNVLITGSVTGDVVAASDQLTIEGDVAGDLWVTGGTVTVNGSVESVRVLAGEVIINGQVTEDLLAVAGITSLAENGLIGRDAWIKSGEVNSAGEVGRNVQVESGRLSISGPVGGDVLASVDTGLVIEPSAQIAGALSYQAPQEFVQDAEKQVAGGITYEQQTDSLAASLAGQVYFFLASFLLLVGILLYARRAAVRASELTKRRAPLSALVGLLFVILIPAVAVLLLVTLVGAPISLLTIGGYVLILYSAKLFVALMVGGLAIRGVRDSFWKALAAGTLGLAAYYLLAIIPILGLVITIVVTLIGSGAQLLLLREVYADLREKYGA